MLALSLTMTLGNPVLDGSGLPALPSGYAYVIDYSGRYFVDYAGRYFIMRVS